MITRAAVLLSALLVGCSSGRGIETAAPPIEITTLAPSYDSTEDTVELAIAFTNTSRQPLKSLQLLVTAYDSAGRLVAGGKGAVAMVQFEGPYEVNAKVGPARFAHLWSGSDVRCLEVSKATLATLDYATTLLSDTAANDLVAADTRRVCRGVPD